MSKYRQKNMILWKNNVEAQKQGDDFSLLMEKGYSFLQ